MQNHQRFYAGGFRENMEGFAGIGVFTFSNDIIISLFLGQKL
jgi:hypothetical protein